MKSEPEIRRRAAESFAGVAPAILSGRRRELSPREREICLYLVRGWKPPEIAEALVISIKTVEVHIRNAKVRRDCRTTAQLTAEFATGRVLA